MIRFLKYFVTILLISLSVSAETLTLKFPAGLYEGEIDNKQRASGFGKFRYNSGEVIEGTFKKNKPTNIKLFVKNELIYEGKVRGSSVNIYLDEKRATRQKIKLKLDIPEPINNSMYEIKKMGAWFEAVNNNGIIELSDKGKIDFQQAQSGGGGSSGGGGGGGCGG